MKRVAICFWGQTRTDKGLEKCYKKLKSDNVQYDFFELHQNSKSRPALGTPSAPLLLSAGSDMYVKISVMLHFKGL